MSHVERAHRRTAIRLERRIPEYVESMGAFARLTQMFLENQMILKELARTRKAALEALSYLARPGANSLLGQARLDQLRSKRSVLLCTLRANRIEARRVHRIP